MKDSTLFSFCGLEQIVALDFKSVPGAGSGPQLVSLKMGSRQRYQQEAADQVHKPLPDLPDRFQPLRILRQ